MTKLYFSKTFHISMSSLRYKSFCLGILLTSLTWAIALYLYASLNSTSSTSDGHNDMLKWKEEKRVVTEPSVIRKRFGSSENLIVDNVEHNDVYHNRIIADKVVHLKNNVDDNSRNRIPKKNKLLPKRARPTPLAKTAVIEGQIKTDLSELGLVRSSSDYTLREEGHKKYAFNLLVSNRLGYHRKIPDTRNPLCKAQTYDIENLPRSSIIICFYNEAKSALLRTVHSVLDRTPENLVEEIILVDDFSENEDLKTELEDYISEKFSPKVKLIHTPQREGLIRARIYGAKFASGQVLVFLDSHCEVNQKWLEPLLTRIHMNRTTVVCPIIDIINPETFVYTASPMVRGGFNWGLHFRWDSLPANTLGGKADFIKPIMSPTMAGGLFAIERKYFYDIGEYDSGMDIWGGENLEMSFRVWMCGGTLEIMPCSRVGHVFRIRRPYGSPTGEDTIMRNSLRLAYVWMDDYKENYFMLRPDARGKPYGNVSDRIELRKKLECRSFDWYLKTVYPELKPPTPHSKDKMLALKHKLAYKAGNFHPRKRQAQNIVAQYQLKLRGSNLCVESEKEVTKKGSFLILRKCQASKSQMWFESDKKELLLADLLCLDVVEDYPRLAKCHEMGGSQEWRRKTKEDAQIYNMAAGMCLGVKRAEVEELLVMEMCTVEEPTTWDLIEAPTKQ